MESEVYRPENVVRVVTATSLFDGHDAAINIMRRILQDAGVEVIHLGHNRSVREIVDAAVEEDAGGVAVSSYQGGHMEFFKYLVDLLKERGAPHVKVFGGGGGVIVPEEIEELESYGVAKIYSPEDGASKGLQGIVNHIVRLIDRPATLATLTMVPRMRGWTAMAGKAAVQASVKPTTYSATAIAWARKNTIPMAPPNSTPRLRLIR